MSPEFHDLFTTSVTMANRTNHLFNPFILPALHRAGYTHSAVDTYKNDYTENYEHRSVTTVNQVKITPKSITIPANTAIDFGGIGKGYLADNLAKLPELKSVDGFWFSIGGDIIGSGVDESGDFWKVAIQDAQNPLHTLKDDTLPQSQQFSIASSGTIVKKFSAQYKHSNTHHIIHPTTLKPATTDILLATIMAPSTCEADVLASCAVLLGSKQAKAFLQNQGINVAILQKDNQEATFLSNKLQGAFA